LHIKYASSVSLKKEKRGDPMQKLVRSFFFMILLAGLSMPAWGVLYDASTNHNLYGNLSQNYNPSVMPPALQAVACVPVATSNSLVYLENMYPNLYNRGLVPDNNPANGLIDTAEIDAVAGTLAGANYMNTLPANGGTWQDMAIYGKYKYVEDNVPGVTSYAAQMSLAWGWRNDGTPPIVKPAWVQDNTFPTWQFLYNNLVDKEDIEICINDGDWGHCLTLTSLHWNDNGDGIIQGGEATIDYIDPATGQWVGASPIFQGLDGLGGYNKFFTVPYGGFQNAVLEMAMKESPEPSTITLFGIGIIGLLAYAWRRKRRA
jgi:hypothetical protein